MTAKKQQAAGAEAAQQEARDADVAAQDAQRALEDSTKSPEQLAAEKAQQDADDARARAQQAEREESDASIKPATVADAGVLVVAEPTLSAADHRAQKFGNDPANPKPAPGVDMTANLVRISRKTPDVEGLVYNEVPEKMVGDYERAGWNRDPAGRL